MGEAGLREETGDRAQNGTRFCFENLKWQGFDCLYNNSTKDNTRMDNAKTFFEEMKVLGKDLAEKVKALIHEGNVRRIIIKDEHGHTFVEIPVTVAAVGALFAPILAAVAGLAAMAAKFTVVVEKSRDAETPPDSTQ
jgi:Domain of unknown function (DUF4342)